MRRACGTLAVVLAALGAAPSHAAVNRILDNGSFEREVTQAPNSYSFPAFEAVNDTNPRPGDKRMAAWATTAPPAMNADRPVEVWGAGFKGIAPADGQQFTELNVTGPDRIFQRLCLASGDAVQWAFSHRGRDTTDTLTAGAFRDGSLTLSSDDPAQLVQAFRTASTPAGAWVAYAGTTTFSAPTGFYEVGWESAAKTGSQAGNGNFLDAVSAEVAPLAEISSSTPSAVDPATGVLPLKLEVAGRLRAPAVLEVALSGTALDPAKVKAGDPTGIAGARATVGADGVVTVTVPAGVHAATLTVPIDLSGQTSRSARLALRAAGGDNGTALPLRVGPAESCTGAGRANLDVRLSPAPADLQVTATSSAVRDGAYLATYAVTNLGPGDASGVSLRATVPDGVTFSAAEVSLGTCTQQDGVVTCTGGALPVGGHGLAVISGRVTTSAATLHSRARLAAVTPDDPNEANNRLDLDTLVADPVVPAPPAPDPPPPAPPEEENSSTPLPADSTADLRVTVRAPSSIARRGLLAFRVTLTNRGPDPAPGTELRFNVPRGARVSLPQGADCSGRPVVICRVGQLATGASVRIGITGRPGQQRRYGVAAGARTESRDTNPRDNVDAAVTRVRAAARMPQRNQRRPAVTG